MERRIDRLDKYLKIKHLSTNKVSVMAGLSTGIISKSREENRDLSDTACIKLLEVLNDLNPEYLYEGTGDMFKVIPNKVIGDNNVGNGNGNTVNSDSAIQELINQLKVKDSQIDRLISLLEKEKTK